MKYRITLRKLKRAYRTFFLCLIIAFIIFLTALFSDISVQFHDFATKPENAGYAIYYDGGIIFLMAIVILIGFTQIPTFKRAMIRMFGMDEKPPKKKTGICKNQNRRNIAWRIRRRTKIEPTKS